MSRSTALALLLAAACTHPAPPAPVPARTAPAPGPGPTVPAGAPAHADTPVPLPPIPLVEGPLVVHVVFPGETSPPSNRDSNYMIGSVGNGHATLTINGHRLTRDHGFPARIIAPNRPGVLQTKWVKALTVST